MNETLNLFLIFAGYIIGLGAVTVIDIHGFLGRKSSYWTQSTIRTHKVTKPLIWIGTFLAIVGSYFLWQKYNFPFEAQFHLSIFGLLILNGLFLTFWVSPRLLKREKDGRDKELLPNSWQTAIAGSFIVSFTGWWGSLYLLIKFLIDNL